MPPGRIESCPADCREFLKRYAMSGRCLHGGQRALDLAQNLRLCRGDTVANVKGARRMRELGNHRLTDEKRFVVRAADCIDVARVQPHRDLPRTEPGRFPRPCPA